jgi:hypothetical protein
MNVVLAQIVLTEDGSVEALVNPNLQGLDPLAACAQGITALAARQVQILNAMNAGEAVQPKPRILVPNMVVGGMR